MPPRWTLSSLKVTTALSLLEYKNATRLRWLNPCFRIMLNHQKGMDKWADIWRYVDGTLPLSVQRRNKMPAAVGDRRQWSIMEDEVPVIDLPYEAKNKRT